MEQRAAQQLDRFLTQATARRVPAATLHIRHRGSVIYERALGWLDPQQRTRPVRLASQFDLASLTKLFTTTAFLRLVAGKYVTLDTAVAGILPAFTALRSIRPYEDPLHPGEWIVVRGEWNVERWQSSGEDAMLVDAGKVTFRHLLAHNSGLPAWRPLFRQPAELIRETVLNTFFSYPTSATVVYSDLGFMILGWAIEQVSGLPLDQAIRQLVLDPLGLSDIQYRPLPAATSGDGMDDQSCVPTEYCAWRGRRICGEVHDENAWAMGGIAGHAGLFGSAAAVATLGQSWLEAVHGASNFLPHLLAQEATSLQAENASVRRGLGWALWTADPEAAIYPLGQGTFGHTGFTGTALYVVPRQQLVIACLTNEVYAGRQSRTIAPFRLALHQQILHSLAIT